MKLFLVLAFVAVAAALPEPIRLPEPAFPQVAEAQDAKVDSVNFVDFVQPEAAPVADVKVNAVKIADAPALVAPEAAEIKIDAVKIADSPAFVAPVAEEAKVSAVKIAYAPALQAEESIDAVRFVDSQPEDLVQFVHLPLLALADIPQAEEVNAVKVVDSPLEDEVQSKVSVVKIADLPAPIELQAPALPVVKEAQFDAVKFVNSPEEVKSSPLELQPILPMFDADMVIPQQIMDLIMAEQMKFPKSGKIFVDPMLR